MSQARQPKRHCVCRSVGRSVGHTFSVRTAVTAPAQLITAPAQPPAIKVPEYTALFFSLCLLTRPFFSQRDICISSYLLIPPYPPRASFLDAPSHLYMRLCPSVRRSVRRSVCPVLFSRVKRTHTRRILCRVSGLVKKRFAASRTFFIN